MKKHIRMGLWLNYVLSFFVVLLITTLLASILIWSMVSTGQFTADRPHKTPFFFLLLISIIFGTFMAALVSRRMAKPMQQLNRAIRQVAKGDFTIQPEPTKGPREFREIYNNFSIMVHELGSIETLRNDFVKNVSHEFKNPIAAIEGYAKLLQGDQVNETDRIEYAGMILYSAGNLSALCSNMLQLSKLEDQEIVVEKSRFRLDEQIRMAVLMLEPEWRKKEMDLDIDLEVINYTWNEELLSQIWVNLISNAIKYTPPHGTISIAMRQLDGEISVSVSDTGMGMNNEVQQRIFDKFYQGDPSRNTRGNGLGLTLVKKIVTLAEGQIQVESIERRGSTFTVTLPAYRS